MPLASGSRTSSNTHPGCVGRYASRNSRAEAKAAACNRIVFSSAHSDCRTAASSSTI